MKLTISLLLLIHAVIHLFGFLKAYKLATIEELQLPVSKLEGQLWLIAAFLIAVLSVFYYLEIQHWVYVGFAGLMLSQYLIIKYWKDAKTGTIPNVFLGILLVMSL